MKKFHKSFPVLFKDMTPKVDVEKGTINDVVVIAKGIDKVGDYIDKKFMQQLVNQGNSLEQGLKSRFGHPNMCDSALGTYIGRYKNFRLTEEAVLADLQLDPVAKESPKGDLYTYTLQMAQKNSDMFGNSIAFIQDEPEQVEVVNENGEPEVRKALRLKSFLASDLVDTPAATTNLFKGDGDFAAKATEFLDENPELFEMVTAHPQVIKEFFIKYQNYKSMSTTTGKKSMLQRFKENAEKIYKELTGKKGIAVTGADGSPAEIVTDQETPAVGDSVVLPDGTPAPDGSYTLGNGDTVTVASGVVSAITPKADESVIENSADEAQIAKEFAELRVQLEEKEKSIAELQKQNAEMLTKLKDLKVNYTPPTRSAETMKKEVKDTTKPLTKDEEKARIKELLDKKKK